MAKVTNQVLVGNEVLYIDEDGRSYYFGDFFRHVVTEAYPLPSLNPSGVTRKSPRQKRPPSQGRGSALQGPLRDCFSQCAARWSQLPDNCPTTPLCHPVSSKELIWQGKQDQGVPCSYFDLYMRCCMSSCTEISITGPDGSGVTGGAISENEECFKCPETRPENPELYVLDTTVPCGGQIELEIVPADFPLPYTIRLISGGGFISGGNTYNAPNDNINCDQNALIALDVCDELIQTVKIGVNCVQGPYQAYHEVTEECWQAASPPDDIICGHEISPSNPYAWAANCNNQVGCDGTILVSGYLSYCWSTNPSDCFGQGFCAHFLQPAIPPIDDRTPAMKAAGCCPGGLA